MILRASSATTPFTVVRGAHPAERGSAWQSRNPTVTSARPRRSCTARGPGRESPRGLQKFRCPADPVRPGFTTRPPVSFTTDEIARAADSADRTAWPAHTRPERLPSSSHRRMPMRRLSVRIRSLSSRIHLHVSSTFAHHLESTHAPPTGSQTSLLSQTTSSVCEPGLGAAPLSRREKVFLLRGFGSPATTTTTRYYYPGPFGAIMRFGQGDRVKSAIVRGDETTDSVIDYLADSTAAR